MHLTIAGLQWRAHSPSYLTLDDSNSPAEVALGYDGRAWRCLFPDGAGPARFPSRLAAAQAIADGINAFIWEQLA